MKTWTPTHYVIAAGIALVAALIAAGLWDSLVVWPAYAREHNCHETGRTKDEYHVSCAHVGNGITTCTPVTLTSSEWRCDGGETIWR